MFTRMTFAKLLNRLAINRTPQSVLFGSIAFVALTGGGILNPQNLDWLMIGDAAQHQIGWEFFRHTAFGQWPVGLNPALGLVFSSSIVFTDSIPLAGFFFKPFSPFLGEHFQYFGIWILLSFVLQFHFAHRILSRFSKDQLSISISSLFFVVSPPFLYRMVHGGYGHIALVSHFLILAAIDHYFDKRSRYSIWIIILCSGLLIQAYFMPMLAAVWLASVVRRFLLGWVRFKEISVEVFTTVSAVLAVAWAAGYFAMGRSINPEGWNYVFRWQPLALIDSGTDGSEGWSRIVRDNAQLVGDTEGFSYLGSGILALALFIAITISLHFLKGRARFVQVIYVALPLVLSISVYVARGSTGVKLPMGLIIFGSLVLLIFDHLRGCLGRSNKSSSQGHPPLLTAVILLALYSLTNSVGFGTNRLFDYPLLPGLKQFTETFRTHGRFIWPAFYGLMILILIGVMRQLGPRWRTVVLAVALIFQLTDSSTALRSVHSRFSNSPKWNSVLNDPRWESWASQYDSIVVAPPLNNDADDLWLSVTKYAAQNRLSTNSGNFSRYDTSLYEVEYQALSTLLADGNFDATTIYIVLDDALWIKMTGNPKLDQNKLITVDLLHVVIP